MRLREMLLGAFLVGAIMGAVGSQEEINASAASAGGFDGRSKLHLADEGRGLCFMPVLRQPILIGHVNHEVSKERSLRHRPNLIAGDAASSLNGCVRTDELGRLTGISHTLVENRPRFLQHFAGCGAFEKERQVFSGGVSAVREISDEIHPGHISRTLRGVQDACDGKLLWRWDIRNVAAGEGNGNERALAYNVIRPYQIGLISSDAHNDECEKRIDCGGFSSPPRPFLFLLFSFFLFSALGVYLISKGIDADFDVLKIGTGSVLLLFGLAILVFGIIHGDLVPRFLAISENVSTAPGIDASATCYSRAENVRVLPIVVTKFKLSNVQRHILGADLVERADNTALQDRPETFNRVRVHRTDNVLMPVVIDGRVREFVEVVAVAGPRVGCEQTDFVGNGLVHKVEYGLRGDALQNLGNDFALAANRADDLDFGCAGIARSAAPLVPMFVFVLTADVGFVYLDHASEFVGLVLAEASADAIAHVQRGLVGAEAHDALNLQRADAFLTDQHHVDDPEPIAERFIRVFEDRSDQNREPIPASLGALATLPMERPICHGINVNIPASRAMDTLRPTACYEVALAIIVGREHVVKLLNCKLFYGLCAGHVGLPQSVGTTYAI